MKPFLALALAIYLAAAPDTPRLGWKKFKTIEDNIGRAGEIRFRNPSADHKSDAKVRIVITPSVPIWFAVAKLEEVAPGKWEVVSNGKGKKFLCEGVGMDTKTADCNLSGEAFMLMMSTQDDLTSIQRPRIEAVQFTSQRNTNPDNPFRVHVVIEFFIWDCVSNCPTDSAKEETNRKTEANRKAETSNPPAELKTTAKGTSSEKVESPARLPETKFSIQEPEKGNTEARKRQAESDTSVEVSSEPSGAEIEVDGDFRGQTPSFFSLPKGQHKIKISLKGFDTWERKIQVTGGKVSISPKLEKQTP